MNKYELQLENYVLYNDDIVKILSLNKEDDNVNILYNDSIIKIDCNELKPIEITEEFLIRNGFEKSSEHDNSFDIWSIKKTNTIELNHFSNTIGRNWYIRIENNDRQTIGSVDIQYIHQFQQILSFYNINDINIEIDFIKSDII